MDERQATAVHPAAVGGAALAAVGLLMAATGYDWTWVFGLAAIAVSAAARPPGVWTRALSLFGVLGGIAAITLSFL